MSHLLPESERSRGEARRVVLARARGSRHPSKLGSISSRSILLTAVVALSMGNAQTASSQSSARVPLGAAALLRGRPEEGLLVLSSGYRNHPYVDADAVVFFGTGAVGDTADVMTASIGVREPHGYGHARLGRFMLSTGAIRPVQMDGIRVLGRARTDTSLEVFCGTPVLPELEHGSFDWLAGARVAQFLFDQRIGAGVSYLQRRDGGARSTEELGADVTLRPLRSLSLTGLSAFDLLHQGLAEARLSLDAHSTRGRAGLFVSERVPARMLPATSLFSVISDAPTRELGTDASLALFPRLDVGATAALEALDDTLGYRAALRTRLRLAETGGALSLEGTRRKLGQNGWTGASAGIDLPLTVQLRTHGTLELVAPDHPNGRGALFPWARIGGSYALTEAWRFAAAIAVRATPEYSRELYTLVRVGYTAQVLP